jgi:DUF4097 and DUF4098 domain-containing protein YvlB
MTDEDTVMNTGNVWELPFGTPAVLELQSEWGNLTLVPVEPGEQPRLELTRGAAENTAVEVEKQGDAVRVRLDPVGSMNWFGSWDSRFTLYVPANVRAHIQTSAGSITARDLTGCELGIKASAGKIDLSHVHGLLHLAADAGSVQGHDVGGFLNVETQAGSVRLEVTELQAGEHRVRASLGSVRLDLARGLDVAVETHTSLGSVRNSYPARQSAAARLLLATEMGSVRVDEGDFGPSPTTAHANAQPEPERPRERPADPELERILKMVESGEISAQEADELLQAMGRA